MAWIPLTPELIAERFGGPELDALKSAALATGQDADELISEAAARLVASVRGYVGACAKNTLGPEGTIPEELTDAALAIAVHRVITRLPGMESLLDKNRVEAYDEGKALLERTAECKFAIIAPESEAEEQPASGRIETLNAPRRQFTRDTMRGVL